MKVLLQDARIIHICERFWIRRDIPLNLAKMILEMEVGDNPQ